MIKHNNKTTKQEPKMMKISHINRKENNRCLKII